MSLRLFATFLRRAALVAFAGAALAGCQGANVPKHLKPIPAALTARMDQMGMSQTSPIFIRIFKEESQLEVWKEQRDGRMALLRTYDICKWSGDLGPKIREGDRQAPEGFYTVRPGQMNPNSNYYLSFDIGYPNEFDRSLGRTGQHLMVHGACSSAGCYSMNDEQAGEIYALARDAFRGGQRSFQVQAFPFRMTPENMARHADNPNMPFWKMLKRGYDHFEVTHRTPKVDVCDHRYVFDADAGAAIFDASAACPAYTVPSAIEQAVAAKQSDDDRLFQVALARLQNDASPQPQATMIASVADPAAAADDGRVPVAAFNEERAARPSLFGRLFNRGGTTTPQPAVAAEREVVVNMPTPRRNPHVAPAVRAADARPGSLTAPLGYQPAEHSTIRARIADAFGVLLNDDR